MHGLQLSTTQLYVSLSLTKPIAASAFIPSTLRYFDKDGFELTPLEQMMYQMHGIRINDHLYHSCNQLDWFVQVPTPTRGVILDHSMLLHRFGLAGELHEQVERVAKYQPLFNKLLHCHPKWGLDFSIDYADNDGVLEVFHIEYDAKERDPVQEMKLSLERQILNTDWEDAAKTIRKRSHEWQHLEGMDQTDWKARFFGFSQAEFTQKAW